MCSRGDGPSLSAGATDGVRVCLDCGSGVSKWCRLCARCKSERSASRRERLAADRRAAREVRVYRCVVCGTEGKETSPTKGRRYCDGCNPRGLRTSCQKCGVDLRKSDQSDKRSVCASCQSEGKRLRDARRRPPSARRAPKQPRVRDYRAERERARGPDWYASRERRRHQKQLARKLRCEVVRLRGGMRRVERLAIKASKPWLAPGLTNAERFAIRYREDPDFNIRQRIRAAMRRRRRGSRIADKLRAALKRGGRVLFEDLLGYSVADLRRHLERQFADGMSWERFNEGAIHIDHIVPLSSFNLDDEHELRAAWALTNLRPLWASDNLEKAGKRVLLL